MMSVYNAWSAFISKTLSVSGQASTAKIVGKETRPGALGGGGLVDNRIAVPE